MAIFVKKNLKIQIATTFIILLALGMLLQSCLLLMVGVRNAIKREVVYTGLQLNLLKKIIVPSVDADSSAAISPLRPAQPSLYSTDFSCVVVNVPGQEVLVENQCKFKQEVQHLSSLAGKEQITKIGYAGITWSLLSYRNEIVIAASPLIDAQGKLLGVIAVEHSLLPVYDSFKKEGKVALIYILINTIILASVGFFRIAKTLLRPIDRLVQLAEKYKPEDNVSFLVQDGGREFWKLTTSLKAMFDRIEEDNRKLRNSIKELEKVNNELQANKAIIVRSEKLASVGRLSAGLAHEIGNPLAIVQGYIDLLGRDDLTAEEKNIFSNKAAFELDRINRLIRQLLDFSKPSTMPPELFRVNTLIEDVAQFISVEKSFKKLLVDLKLEAEKDIVTTEKEALRQVVLNCLLNASDAMADELQENKKINVSTWNSDSDTSRSTETRACIWISIKDAGPGIPQEQLENVFDPFFTTKEAGKGTGLGLFVSYTIMERLGGTISIRNRKSRGVEVLLSLPS